LQKILLVCTWLLRNFLAGSPVRNIVASHPVGRDALSSFFQKQSPTWRGIKAIPFCEGATTRRQAFLTFQLLSCVYSATGGTHLAAMSVTLGDSW
jgi:hypothetical protein